MLKGRGLAEYSDLYFGMCEHNSGRISEWGDHGNIN